MDTSFVLQEIKITRVGKSLVKEVNFAQLGFGKVFSDHMLVADYANGQWQQPEIIPFQPISISPSNSTLHYGQAIFEGLKAYRTQQGDVVIFRPYDNFKRFNLSADRMDMPAVPEEIFIEGMKKLVDLDRAWVPAQPDCSLYIRPFMIAMDEYIGVRTSLSYRFMIITSPAGAYYNKPVKLYVQDKYVRAFPGGTGYAKAAGNYAAALKPTREVQEMGYDQILWTDGIHHRYLQECGTMNVFVVIGDKAITPDLSEGTILAGVTRNSVITLLHDEGIEVEERPISIDEVIRAHEEGQLREIFGTGTAASISYVSELTYREHQITFDIAQWKIAPTILRKLNDIKEGRLPDRYGWNLRV
ncbi:MAG: branched-chain amino acid aminotransferase [Thermoflavifilum sp.]|nr:branched-chain amino acid aminotransferase [Thermoflavifilum sp.]